MPLDADLLGGSISPLVREEGSVVGQPGGGPLANKIPVSVDQRFRAALSGVSSAAGDLTLQLGSPGSGYAWLVERIGIKGGGTCTFYVNAVTDAGIVDYSPSGAFDIADENSPIYVPGGQPFIAVFAGAGNATTCTVTFQARLVIDATG